MKVSFRRNVPWNCGCVAGHCRFTDAEYKHLALRLVRELFETRFGVCVEYAGYSLCLTMHEEHNAYSALLRAWHAAKARAIWVVWCCRANGYGRDIGTCIANKLMEVEKDAILSKWFVRW